MYSNAICALGTSAFSWFHQTRDLEKVSLQTRKSHVPSISCLASLTLDQDHLVACLWWQSGSALRHTLRSVQDSPKGILRGSRCFISLSMTSAPRLWTSTMMSRGQCWKRQSRSRCWSLSNGPARGRRLPLAFSASTMTIAANTII